MSMRSLLRSVVPVVCVGALAAGPLAGSLHAQVQQGTIAGRVTDAASGQPIASAQLQVVGTNAGTMTNADGQFTIRNVAAGTYEVRALRVGFAEQKQSVRVTTGATATANFQMHAVATTLTPVVTTATGEQRRVEVGNAVAQVNVADVVSTQAVSNIADVLAARTAGVLVTPPTQVGAGTRFRIRGTSSLSLTNNPIFIVDGIRVEGTTGSSSVSVGGTTPSRVNDLNPEEIENIEIIRGPSASTLYGTDAANGVVVITTKKGVAGRPQWTYYTEQTAVQDLNDYPTAYWGWRTGTTAGTTSSPSNTVQCFLTQTVSNVCKQDSVTSFNLAHDKDATPFGTGYRQQHGLQLRGGSDALRYFVHGEYESEDGPTKVPEFDQRWLAARGLTLRDRDKNPNAMTRMTARTNLNLSLPRNLDLALNAGYTSEDLFLPMSDDSGTLGIAANTYGGPGFKYNLNAAGDTLFGWRQFVPHDVYQTETTQGIERLISSASANWRPESWLALRSNFGLDYTNRLDTQLCRFGECPELTAADRQGYKTDNRSNFFIYTLDAAGTATKSLTSTLESKTTVGFQFYRNLFDRNGSDGRPLPPGAVTVTAGAVKAADEATTESRTLGGFVEQNLAWRDRLFVTGAVRSDRNSAFGANFKTVFYPKLSVSYVLSEEPGLHIPAFFNQLRFRSAYGASGVQPGTIDALPYFSAGRTLGESGEQPAVLFQTAGNPNLKPERSTELEVGLDATFWNNRINTEITYYNKTSRDALISRVVPPSAGTGSTTRLENLGEVRNAGWEGLLNATLVQHARFGWDATLTASANRNRLVSLGGLPNIVSSSTSQQREGYPLNGWWSRRLISWDDKDGNGIITYNANPALSEIVVGDTAEYHGYSIPKIEMSLTNGVDLFSRRLRLAAMVDYKGGHLIYNNSERIRCASRNNCRGLIDKTAPLWEQARVVAVREHPSRTVAGFFEPGDFVRLREVSATFSASPALASRIRARSLGLTAAVRNAGILWTRYTGVDPEAFGTTGDAPSSFQAFAPPTYFSLRLNVGF
ncbi:TonB-dependent outer membrane protein, SusC/RagA [Gemmatirosa kalamazoonensis]|uniref:TonB-dependent outer membrane protein, SusC/RagA n=2 Tax=Gemmatirosa kalamazoonensis TaxID=861299 RepID=W0RG58_9BACT|nr:TonB-dependent outer membrane protein, SusC/RagA [Gemmatirosa kalamazoonensis]